MLEKRSAIPVFLVGMFIYTCFHNLSSFHVLRNPCLHLPQSLFSIRPPSFWKIYLFWRNLFITSYHKFQMLSPAFYHILSQIWNIVPCFCYPTPHFLEVLWKRANQARQGIFLILYVQNCTDFFLFSWTTVKVEN